MRRWLAEKLCPGAFAEAAEARDALARVLDPELKHMRLENGQLDMAVAGDVVKNLAATMTEWFRSSDAANYVEMTLHARTAPFESYVFTVQKRGDGGRSPHELREIAERRVAELEAQLAPAPASDPAQREGEAK